METGDAVLTVRTLSLSVLLVVGLAAVAWIGCAGRFESSSPGERREVRKPIEMDSGVEPPREILLPDAPPIPPEIQGPSPIITPSS